MRNRLFSNMDIIDHLELVKENVDLFCVLDISEDETEDVIENFPEERILTNGSVTTEREDVQPLDVPDIFTSVESRVKFMIETGIQSDLIESDDTIGFVLESRGLHVYAVTQISAGEVSVSSEIRNFFFESQPDPDTLQQTLKIAVNLSRTGHKGEPVGALFVIGDEDNALNHSRPLNYNPFSGADVHIGDESVSASIGEYAKLDGAFVISDSGQIISANRYMEPRVHDADIPSGLGARHMAASGITSVTDAVAIVVSETDQKIRCFVDGEIVVSSDPDEVELAL